MRILIAEDEPKARQFLLEHFQAAGYEVDATSSSLGVFDGLHRRPTDVLLLDMWLEDSTDGVNVLREVRKMSPKTAVIVLTGVEEDNTRETVLGLGALALFNKPIRLDELDDLLARLSKQA